ncbi:MAG: CHAT domain-containing protein [Moorea sp. SIO2B7]|nr:CHAT domain-containing protein [Moorena sp. SIO2B7]
MKRLKLFLTVPQRAELGEIQINAENEAGHGQAFYLSQLPWFEDKTRWRTTMIKALGAVEFKPNLFPDADEINWMVNQGWLTSEKKHFASDILKKMGQDIYNTLFPKDKEEARNLLQRSLASLETNEQLHISIQFSQQIDQRGRLPDYPWELACDQQGFLAQRQITFSRFIAFVENIPQLPPVNTINVLLISSRVGDSDPDINLPSLNSQEQKAILRGLKKAEEEGKIVVKSKKALTFKEFGDYLTQIVPEKAPHIIHFDGHGFFGKRCNKCRTIHKKLRATHCRNCGSPLESDPQGYLLFEPNVDDLDKDADYISATEISDLIKTSNLDLEDKPESGVRLVVMSACKSGMTLGSDSAFNGIAQQLIAQKITAVVAMQYNVTIEGAKAFAERFYRALGNKKALSIAVSSGQEVMSREGNQWYRPVLYLRSLDEKGGQLFADTEDAKVTKSDTVTNADINPNPSPPSNSLIEIKEKSKAELSEISRMSYLSANNDLISMKENYLDQLYQQLKAAYEIFAQVTEAEATRVQFEINGLQKKINNVNREIADIKPINKPQGDRQTPFQQVSSEELFERGTELIKTAKKRVALVAKTPIPLVGTRPYGEQFDSYPYELAQLEAIESIIFKAISGKIVFRCVA